jgi:hypothetical protein
MSNMTLVDDKCYKDLCSFSKLYDLNIICFNNIQGDELKSDESFHTHTLKRNI